MIDLSGLNEQQLEAVLTTEGPVLVLAGAGSGKTRVITFRLAHLISRGVPPHAILCVTFTNKAAHEMRQRARKLAGSSVKKTTISTFHSLGALILRRFPERVGLRPGFTISDAGEQIGFLRRILRDLRIDDRRFDAKRIMAMLSMAKNAGLDAETYRSQRGHLTVVKEGPLEAVAAGALDDEYTAAAIESYDRYESGLRAQNVVDFDDLLLMTVRLLARDAEVLELLRAKWRYLMIDEYQDTNGAQLELMRRLAGVERNLCVVGDDDQSIYGWRGADISNILGFRGHFPGAKIVKLEMNYRSTGAILSVANAIIEKNSQRHDKRLKPFAGPGDPVRIVALENEEVEAEQVAAVVFDLLHHNVTAGEIAVLFRSNVQSRPLELAFRTAGIPYRVAGGQELFDRREVKDTIAYLRLLDNPEDEQSLRRVINFPPRGIGDSTVEKIDRWARAQGLSLWAGLLRVAEVPGIVDRSADAVCEFVSMMNEHRGLLERRKLSTVVKKLFETVGIENVLFESSDNPASASRRVDNVREILKETERYENRLKKGGEDEPELDEDLSDSRPTLSGFLSDLALGVREDIKPTKPEDRKDQVVLSTVHAAKGLEWKHVFLVGAEEELLPHAKTLDGAGPFVASSRAANHVDGEASEAHSSPEMTGGGQIEEERRLAYVAVTRAREKLTISYASSRTRWGRVVKRTRSRFLEDLPEESVAREEGTIEVKRSAAEKEALAEHYMQAIRAKLGMS